MDKIQLEFSLEELKLLLEGLSKLPYYKVNALINQLQVQARQQMNRQVQKEGDESIN